MLRSRLTKTNIIFLDFDGVLNSERSVVAYRSDLHNIGWQPEGLDEIAVRLVRTLAEEANASVVISSSWRFHYPDEQLAKFLSSKGWPSCPIIGHTPNISYLGMYSNSGYNVAFRGNEIGAFLDEFVASGKELGTWVILDDSKDFHYNETTMGGFRSKQPVVNTDPRIGFSLKNFYDALKILKPYSELLQHIEMKLIP